MKRIAAIALATLWAFFVKFGYAFEAAPGFELPLLDSEELATLESFQGQILVLDFFNVNCGDCFQASWELQSGIQEYYAERSGNPHGFPVQVVAVNSEVADQKEMDVFIEETGLEIILDDPKAELLQRYGGSSLPYIVIIDATDLTSHTHFVVFRQAKHDGLKKVRSVIDSITGESREVDSAPSVQPPSGDQAAGSLAQLEQKPLYTHDTTLDLATMMASDVCVTDATAEYKYKSSPLELDLAATYRLFMMDFVSEPRNVRHKSDLSENYFAIQATPSVDLTENLEFNLSGGVYEGFQTYRTLWMDRYYRLRFDTLGEFAGYKKAHPWGYNASTGFRWGYIPDIAFASAGVAYQYDIVSPGYMEDWRLRRLRDRYETLGSYVALENIVTRRVRTLLEGRVDDTTERKPRMTLQGAVNFAFAESWVTRLTAGYAREDPEFEAKSVGAVIERDWHNIWFVSLFARYYRDTSEIENGISNFTTAPPLRTYHAGIGLRRQRNHSSVRIDAGPCFSRYKPHHDRNRDIDQLYKDRDWIAIQIAFGYRF